MEWNFARTISRHLAVSWTVGTQSREVDFRGPDGTDKVNLGSIEQLPNDLVLQYHFRPGGRFHPYVGAGINATLFWEKSGALDSTDLTPGFGPVAEIGFDYDISSHMIFNVDVRLARLETDLEGGGTRIATLSLHPSTLGAGIGFRF
jgi:outer membrane protein